MIIDRILKRLTPKKFEKLKETEIDQLQRIKEYYEECHSSFQHWGEEGPYNMHYGFWDENTYSHIQSLINTNRVLAERVKVISGDKILDAGCGMGASAIWLAKHYNVEVIGITISELEYKKAQIFAKAAGVLDKVKFYIGDFTNTNFNDESFDIIWGIESVCHIINKKDFIKEARRILKNNGKLIISDGFIKKDNLNKLDEWLLDNWIKRWRVPNLVKVSDFQKYLEETRFKNVKFIDITKNILPSSREIFKRGILGWPVYKLKRKNLIQMNHVEGCIFQYLALKRGIWIYEILYAEK